MSKPRVLIVEDDPDGCRSVREAIEDQGYEAATALTGADGVRMFAEEPADVVLSDLVLPDFTGTEVMARIRRVDPLVPVLIMTAHGTVSSAVEAMKGGAFDYLTKPLNLDELQAKVARALETRRLRREVEQLRESVHGRFGVNAIVARAPGMRAVLEQVLTLAATTTTVHIHGESGTGKELVARALHVDGPRRTGPFVAVNGGAFTESLLESELFGHEKGAFTGAVERRRGAFERADGGTLFLDEVGTAPPPVQVKLLRVLEDRNVMRVGGEKSLRVDVRVVSASNRDLDELVAEGKFRQDLLYRLNVFTLRIPPLRQRREDIRLLAEHFVAQACEEHGRPLMTLGEEAVRVLETRDWPGNVRQLKNVIEASVVLAKGAVLEPDDLRLGPAGVRRADGSFVVPDNASMADMEKEILAQLLKRNDGNRTLVADKLGVSRRTIQRKIKDFGLPY